MKTSHVPTIVIAVIATAAQGVADVTLAPFDVAATFESVSVPLDTSVGAPDSYDSYTVTMTWDTDATGSFSDEAVWELAQPGSLYLLTAPGPSPDSTDEADPVTLTWTGLLTETHQAGDPLVFRASQTLRHTSASWTNVSITLHTGVVDPPPLPVAVDLGSVQDGWANAYAPLDSNGIAWFKFTAPDVTTAGCDVLRVDTIGSDLSGGTYRGGSDTEIAVYNAIGQLRATGDDVDMLAEELHAALSFGANEGVPVESSGDLSAGEYFVAVAGFDADFGPGHFEVTPDSAVEGTLRFNVRYGEPLRDCNENGLADVCDLGSGSSVDVNTNGIPDECEDCNENGTLDTDEIAAGLVADCNSNSVPDVCDVARDDCNFNGQVDSCEIVAGSSADCNLNGIPDLCDILLRDSEDCNSNSRPDECDFEPKQLFAAIVNEYVHGTPSLSTLLYEDLLFWIGYFDTLDWQMPGFAIEPVPNGTMYGLLAPCEPGEPCATRSLVRFEPMNVLISIVEIGQISEEIVDITFHPNGTMYGVIGDAGTIPGEIVTIDTETAAITYLGVYASAPGYEDRVDGHAIAFHPRTGLMYHTYCGAPACYLEKLNLDTGSLQRLDGLVGLNLALVYDEESGKLLGCSGGSINLIDPDTGERTSSGISSTSGCSGLAFSVPALDCNSNAVPDVCDVAGGVAADFDSDGLLDVCDYDSDNDGLQNASDVCDFTPAGEAITVFGGPVGAWTDDCLVNIADYPFYAACLEAGGPSADPGGECLSVFDVTGDGQVDLRDFAAFQGAFGS